MGGDEVDEALFHVRPDRGALRLARGGPAQVPGGLAELGEVGDGHDDVELPLLVRGRLHDLDGTTPGEEATDLVDRSDGRLDVYWRHEFYDIGLTETSNLVPRLGPGQGR